MNQSEKNQTVLAGTAYRQPWRTLDRDRDRPPQWHQLGGKTGQIMDRYPANWEHHQPFTHQIGSVGKYDYQN